MIKSIHAVTKEPFNRTELTLLSQQKQIVEIIKSTHNKAGFRLLLESLAWAKLSLKNILKV